MFDAACVGPRFVYYAFGLVTYLIVSTNIALGLPIERPKCKDDFGCQCIGVSVNIIDLTAYSMDALQKLVDEAL